MIKYTFGTHQHGETNKIYPTLKVDFPFQGLTLIGAIDDLEDLDIFIEWLEDLINRDVPDFSEPGLIIYQPMLCGSKKSKIIEFVDNEKYIEGQEFDTADLLQLCKEWREFINKKKDK